MRKIIPFLCVFMYFMSPYRLGGHQMPEIIGLLAVALALILGFRVQFEKSYLLFVAYMWIVPPMIGIACGISGNYRQALIPVGLILSTLYIGFLPLNIKKDYVLKYYKLLVYLAIAFFVIQELSYNVTGHRPTLYLTFLETYYEDLDAVLFALSRAGLDRSSSFFLEPSHFAQYIIPYFCIIVSKYAKEKTGLKEVIIVFLIIIWIRSGVGYVSLLAIAGFFFLKSDVMKINQ